MSDYATLFEQRTNICSTALGAVGRLAYLAAPLALVFLGEASGGQGPALAASFSIGAAVGYPISSALSVRWGPVRVLALTALAAALLGCLVSFPSESRIAFALGCGVVYPPVGPIMRARWSTVLSTERQRHAARAFEATLTEVLAVAGPLVVAILATLLTPRSAWLTLLGVAVLSTLALCLFLSDTGRKGSHYSPGASRMTLWNRHVVCLLSTVVLGAAGIAVAQVSVSADLIDEGREVWVGIVISSLGISSAAGGVWYGTVRRTMPPHLLYACALGLSGLGQALMMWVAIERGPLAALPIAVCAGLPLAIASIEEFALLEAAVRPAALASAVALLLSANSVGVAIGASLAGLARGLQLDSAVSSAAALGFMLAGALLGLATFRRGEPPAGADSAPHDGISGSRAVWLV